MTEGVPESNPILAGRYRLEGELGRGGMATVYLALDRKHGRRVALKVFRQDLAAAVGPDRFLREIEITAGLNHPHILPLLDSGTAGGLLYYVMPYVAGGSLRRLLTGDHDIPLEVVLRMVREVASALDHAHKQGVVHRDIKPENILFNEGLAVVGDFGIAQAVSAAPKQHLTRTGVAVGTLGYMSPEQALGTAELDGRSDVFSLACVIYEMLTGGTPSSWPVPEDVRLGRLGDLPFRHRARLDRLPGRVEQVLAKALALRPSDRFATAGEMTQALTEASERTPAFSEEQVRLLLDRAAALQALEPLDEGALTMGAVEQIAAEVGIPREHVRIAARELGGGRSGVLVPGVGSTGPARGAAWKKSGKEKWNRALVVLGWEGEVPEAAYPAMVEEIQDRLGIVGHASVLAGALTWSPATQSEDSRRLVITVRPKDGVTQVRIQEEFGLGGARKAVLPVGVFAGAGSGALFGGLLGLGPLLLAPGAILGVPLAIHLLIRIETRTRRPQLLALAERIREMGEAAMERRLGPV